MSKLFWQIFSWNQSTKPQCFHVLLISSKSKRKRKKPAIGQFVPFFVYFILAIFKAASVRVKVNIPATWKFQRNRRKFSYLFGLFVSFHSLPLFPDFVHFNFWIFNSTFCMICKFAQVSCCVNWASKTKSSSAE